MGTFSVLKNHAYMLRNHRALVGWYLRNRVRQAVLPLDRRRADGWSRPPRGITIKPTLACNLRCRMCGYASSGEVESNPNGQMAIEEWVALIRDISSFRPYVSLTGGEPLLYPSICELIATVKKSGLICTVTTNGTLLAKRAEQIMEYPPDVLIVSIDGPSDLHNEIRGVPGCYDRTVKGIEAIMLVKKRSGVRKPFLIVNCAITSFNYDSVEQVVDVARGLGIDALNFQHQWSLTRRMADAHNRRHGEFHQISLDEVGEIDLPPADADQARDTVRRLRKRAHTSNGGLYITFYPELDDGEVHAWYSDPHKWVRRSPAVCAWLNTDILPNGDVEPCPGLVCGNIRKSSFVEIWNNEKFRAHRQRLLAHGDLPICVRCCAYMRRD